VDSFAPGLEKRAPKHTDTHIDTLAHMRGLPAAHVRFWRLATGGVVVAIVVVIVVKLRR